jgi:hypothetical protein
MFMLEMDDDIEVDTAANELGISLHALTSIDVANTMKLHIRTRARHWLHSWTLVPHIPSSRRAFYLNSAWR